MNHPVLEREALHTVRLTLNGRARSGQARPRLLLSDFLRHVLGATGTHVGCEHGVCGCCTVLLDGTAVRACLTLAVQAEGRTLRTVESLADASGKLKGGTLPAKATFTIGGVNLTFDVTGDVEAG